MDPITITVPPAAAQRIAAIVGQRQTIEAQLADAIALLAAALAVPDGWQLQVDAGGQMVFVPPAKQDA